MEDVVSWGLFGLLGAVEIYGLGRRTTFEFYAISKVRWVILNELRKVDSLPREARLRMRETERARNELAQTLGRVPTEPEVARRLGVEVGEHRAAGPVCAGTGGVPEGSDGVQAGARSPSGRTDPVSAAEAAEYWARLV